MVKLTPALKITLIILTVILACAAIATPIILLTSANSDTNLTDHPQPSINQNTPTGPSNPEPETAPTEDSETHIEEELRARRDQQRRNDMALLQSAVAQFQVNNNGKLPGQGSNLDGQGELVYQPSKDHILPSANDGVAAKLIVYYLNPVSTSENYFIDPDGWTYGLTIVDYTHYQNSPERFADHMIYLIHQADCSAAGLASSDKPRNFTIVYKLENGNAYCLDNQ